LLSPGSSSDPLPSLAVAAVLTAATFLFFVLLLAIGGSTFLDGFLLGVGQLAPFLRSEGVLEAVRFDSGTRSRLLASFTALLGGLAIGSAGCSDRTGSTRLVGLDEVCQVGARPREIVLEFRVTLNLGNPSLDG
jgi:hypothetical protein